VQNEHKTETTVTKDGTQNNFDFRASIDRFIVFLFVLSVTRNSSDEPLAPFAHIVKCAQVIVKSKRVQRATSSWIKVFRQPVRCLNIENRCENLFDLGDQFRFVRLL